MATIFRCARVRGDGPSMSVRKRGPRVTKSRGLRLETLTMLGTLPRVQRATRYTQVSSPRASFSSNVLIQAIFILLSLTPGEPSCRGEDWSMVYGRHRSPQTWRKTPSCHRMLSFHLGSGRSRCEPARHHVMCLCKNIDTNITAVHRKKVFETCFIHHCRMIALRTIDFCSSVKVHYRQGRTLSLHLEPAPA